MASIPKQQIISNLSKTEMDSASLIKLLDCPVCLQVPQPPILMCNRGHNICQTCRDKLQSCPVCESDFSTARNLLAEQLVETLHRKCPFSKEGCKRTILTKDWESHLNSCDFRQVECDIQQVKSCRDVKMKYNNYFTHLKNVHGIQGIQGTILNVTQFVTYEQSRLEAAMPRGMWPVQFIEVYNEIFLTGTAAVSGKIYWWIYIIGNDKVADNYMARVSLILKTKCIETSWTGPVHSFRTVPETILQEGLCLLATPETLHPFTHMKLMQVGDGQILMEQNDKPNVGWNVTFSIMKRDLKQPGRTPLNPLPSKPSKQLKLNEQLGKQFAAMKLEPSDPPSRPTGPSSSKSQPLIIKQEPLTPDKAQNATQEPSVSSKKARSKKIKKEKSTSDLMGWDDFPTK